MSRVATRLGRATYATVAVFVPFFALASRSFRDVGLYVSIGVMALFAVLMCTKRARRLFGNTGVLFVRGVLLDRLCSSMHVLYYVGDLDVIWAACAIFVCCLIAFDDDE